LTTQELLLLTLCSLAVAPPPPAPPPHHHHLGVSLAAAAPPRQPAAELLLQLAGAHVAAARAELEAALLGHPRAAHAVAPAPVALTPLQQHHRDQLAAGACRQHSPSGGLLSGLHARAADCSCHHAAPGAAPHFQPTTAAPAPASSLPGHWAAAAAPAGAGAGGSGGGRALPEAVACLEALTALVAGLGSSAPAARDASKASRQAVAAVLSRSAPRLAPSLGGGPAPSAGSGAAGRGGGGGGSVLSGAGSAISMDDACSAGSGAPAEPPPRRCCGSGGRNGEAEVARGGQGAKPKRGGQRQRGGGGGGDGSGGGSGEAAAAAAAAAAAQQQPPFLPLTPAQAAAATRERRSTQAATRLLAHSWEAVRLSFRAVCEGRTGWEVLLPAAAGVLEAGLPAVQAQCEAARAGGSEDGGDGLFGAQASGPELARECVAQVVLQLLQPLPPPLLRQPCCLRLLERALCAAAVGCLLPSADGAAEAEAAAGWGGADASLLLEKQPAVTAAAHALLQRALYEACVAVLQPECPPDPALVVAALQLAGTTLRAAPQALAAAGVLELLLPATRAALATQHLEQCSAALLWAQQLATAPFLEAEAPPAPPLHAPPLAPPHWPPQQAALAAAAAAWRAQEAARRRGALSQLRAKLEAGGEGAQIVLALLLAASGQMPPDVILAVSTCLHSIWRAAGPPAFAGWLEAAVMRLAPDGAPWVRSSRAAKLAFVRDLSDASNWGDVARFKRAIKSFCTGKKAAGGGGGGGGSR
jgi:hypothetical protein